MVQYLYSEHRFFASKPGASRQDWREAKGAWDEFFLSEKRLDAEQKRIDEERARAVEGSKISSASTSFGGRSGEAGVSTSSMGVSGKQQMLLMTEDEMIGDGMSLEAEARDMSWGDAAKVAAAALGFGEGGGAIR